MGTLPAERVQPSRPFTNTGVDYAEPIWLKAPPGRGRKFMKGYLAVFVCMTTKATHLKIVSDYSTPGFLAAFRRFMSRRGLCRHVFSDNGSNFHGADTELKALLRAASPVVTTVAKQGIEWHFTPPYAPNFDGLWEATVKSCKTHLKRVIGKNIITYEDLSTLVAQFEACLNSRPLSYLSSNEKDLIALAPGHFLIGSAIISPPDKAEKISSCLTTRWKLVQQIRDDFWARCSREHLTYLQQRSKWVRPQPNIQVGDVVVVKSELQPASQWLLGRITRCYHGNDGLCRVALVHTKKGEYRRPISKLVLLPMHNENRPPTGMAGGELADP